MSATDSQPDGTTVRALLLHRLLPPEAERLEQLLLCDDDFAALVRDAENDLLDDYAQGHLGAEDRDAVERFLLQTPQDRRRLAVARALALKGPHKQRQQRIVSPRHRRARLGLVAALLAASLTVVLVSNQILWRSPGDAGGIYTVALLADTERGVVQQTLTLPTGTAQLRLQLEIAKVDARARYRMTIEDTDGHLLFQRDDLHAQSAGPVHYVEAEVPTKLLGSGQRRIAVRSAEPSSYASEIEVEIRHAP